MVKKKTTKKKVTKKKAVKKKTVKKKVVKKKTGRQKLQEQMEAKNKEQEDAFVAEDEVTEDEVTEDEVNDNTDKEDDIDKVDSDTSDEEIKSEEVETDKKSKKLKPVIYAEMIQAFSIFLTTDVMLLKYKLSIRSAGPKRHVVFQGMVSNKWADLRSGGSSLFRRTSLLRRIKTLDKDSELYRYFENYTLTTGKESYVNNG